MLRRAIPAFIVAIAILANSTLWAQFPEPQNCFAPVLSDPPALPRDNTEGSFINFETTPIHPLDFDGQSWLLAVNQPGARLVIIDPSNGVLSTTPEWKWNIGPGAVTIKRRAGTLEVWVVDKVVGMVFVYDLLHQNVAYAIRVGAEPHGLAFSSQNDRAYVACSAVDRVDVIDLRPGVVTAYQVVQSIPVPMKQPRAIVTGPNRAYVASFRSGNNTATKAINGVVLDAEVAKVTAAEGAQQELPDIDLAVIQTNLNPATDVLVPAESRRGLGTTLFNIHRRPGTSELWIPNTEALNADFVGEKNFVGGKVVRNRISIVTPSSNTPEILDLDALMPAGVGCAQPTGIDFHPGLDRAYVCAYGSDLVVVLKASTREYIGNFRIQSRGAWRAGPRTCQVDTVRNQLYVFNKNDNSVTLINLLNLSPAGGPQASLPTSLGYDPTPVAVKRGRGHLINGNHSLSKTSSCASCHVDGDADGLAWELSQFLDPEGTTNPTFPTDRKGPMVTQSLRGLRESPPYHWRGEKDNLESFNDAFVGLLKRPTPLPASAFADLKAYMESLVYPANPRAELDRSLSPTAAVGASMFIDPQVAGCSGCHVLPLGTQNETFLELVGGPAFAFKVTQIRGVHDKLRPEFFAGGPFGRNGMTTQLGAGLLHNGMMPSGLQFLDHFFNLSSCQEFLVDRFLSSYDTGLAPSTAFAATVTQANWQNFWKLDFLIAQADAGHCDFYVFGTIEVPGITPIHLAGAYQPGTGSVWQYQFNWGLFPVAILKDLAGAGYGNWTFVGVPVGLGWRMGVDQDLDWMPEWDETAFGTNPEDNDTDNDSLPDGYERFASMDPLTPDFPPFSNDPNPPAILNVETVYATTNTLKVTCRTSEAARVEFAWAFGTLGSAAPVISPSHGSFDVRHDAVLQEVPAGVAVIVLITAFDPAGNMSATTSHLVSTVPFITPFVTRVESILASVTPGGSATTPFQLNAEVKISGRFFETYANQVVHAAIYLERNGILELFAADSLETTGSDGVARWINVALPASLSTSVNRKLHFVATFVEGFHPSQIPLTPILYNEPLDLMTFATATF